TRFSEALRQLSKSELFGKLLEREQWTVDETMAVGRDYFQQGIACPFLEEESCSIHRDRPVSCREYLVTSPAANCSTPTAENVRMLEFPFKVWWGLARFDAHPASAQSVPWVPLILALKWSEEHPGAEPARPGPEMLAQLFKNLTGKETLAPQLPMA